jgi:hypothetical protein
VSLPFSQVARRTMMLAQSQKVEAVARQQQGKVPCVSPLGGMGCVCKSSSTIQFKCRMFTTDYTVVPRPPGTETNTLTFETLPIAPLNLRIQYAETIDNKSQVYCLSPRYMCKCTSCIQT